MVHPNESGPVGHPPHSAEQAAQAGWPQPPQTNRPQSNWPQSDWPQSQGQPQQAPGWPQSQPQQAGGWPQAQGQPQQAGGWPQAQGQPQAQQQQAGGRPQAQGQPQQAAGWPQTQPQQSGGWPQPQPGGAPNPLLTDSVATAPQTKWAPQPGSVYCRLCGSVPAVATKFHSRQGMIIIMRTHTYAGPYCHDCGLATYRSATAMTLVAGWWGWLSLIASPFTILFNYINSFKVRKLAPPQSGAPGRRPLSPGKPLFLRWQIIGLAIPFFILLIVIVAIASGGDSGTGTAS